MKKLDRFNKIISNLNNISQEDIDFIENIDIKYPYFQLPKYLYLKGLKNKKSFKFTEELNTISLEISSNENLFKFLHSEYFFKKNKESKENKENKENKVSKNYNDVKELEEVTLELIKDNRLEEYKNNHTEKILISEPIETEEKQKKYDDSTKINANTPISEKYLDIKKTFKNKEKYIYNSTINLKFTDEDYGIYYSLLDEAKDIKDELKKIIEDNKIKPLKIKGLLESRKIFYLAYSSLSKELYTEDDYIINNSDIIYDDINTIEKISNKILKTNSSNLKEDSIHKKHIRLLEERKLSPIEFIENNTEKFSYDTDNLKEIIENHKEKELYEYKNKIKKLLEDLEKKISTSNKDINNVCINFNLSKEKQKINPKDITKLINYNKYDISLYPIIENLLDKVEDRDILELVYIGEEDKNDIEVINNNEATHIKYIEGKPIKCLKAEKISEKENRDKVYINFLTLLDYYKRDFFLKLEKSNNIEIIPTLKKQFDNISKISKSEENFTFTNLFSNIFNYRKSIYNYKYEIIHKNKINKLIDDDAEKLSVLLNQKNREYLKLINIFSNYKLLEERSKVEKEEFKKIEFKKYECVVPLNYTKEDIKLLENNKIVAVEKFKCNVEKIEETFKRRFRILGRNYEKKKENEKENLINDFLSKNIENTIKIKTVNIKDENDIDLSENSFSELKIVSETLANIYKKQKKHKRAIDIFERLINQNPEKEEYYLTKILELKKLDTRKE